MEKKDIQQPRYQTYRIFNLILDELTEEEKALIEEKLIETYKTRILILTMKFV